MAGFIEGVDRGQSVLFPDWLDDWIGEDSVVRVVDFFVEALDLQRLGFSRSAPARTGRPGYHPAVLLKLFIYGYLNRIPSSRRLEREAGRNVELMWLTGKLVPDHKTIADFRRDNGAGIRKVCAQFVALCRRIGTLKGDCVAIDGSKFKAVNNRDRNFTKGKIASRIAHLEADVERYITEMVRIDRQEEGEARAGKVEHLSRRYGRIRQEIARLKEMDKALADAPDGQISLTDPDARAMATSARNSGLVGYNVQSAVDAETHLIVAHEVTDQGFDREQLSPMAIAAKAALGRDDLHAIADKGYFSGPEILACHEAGITTTVPRPATSGNAAKGMYVKAGLRLRRRPGRLCLPGRRRPDLPLHDRGTRDPDPAKLDQRMQDLPAPEQLHDRQRAADFTLGTRGSGRRHGWASRARPGLHDAAPLHRRAPVRHDQGVDGRHPFPDAQAAERPQRDGAERSGLQHQTNGRPARRQGADAGHAGVITDGDSRRAEP